VDGGEVPRGLKDLVDRIQPVDMTTFHGNLDPTTLSFLERWAIKNVKAPVGDFRDWEMVTKWAEGIIASLKERQAP
jgi:menaquinone-dependent protoporphyrinogen oxidase